MADTVHKGLQYIACPCFPYIIIDSTDFMKYLPVC